MPYKHKEDAAKFQRKYYLKRKGPEFNKQLRCLARKLAKKKKQFIVDYVMQHPCVDCGEKDPIVLEFDHVRGKKLFHLADYRGKGWDILKVEMAKCDIRCANCHRKKSYAEGAHMTNMPYPEEY